MENVTLPEGVDEEDVEIVSDVKAIDKTNPDPYEHKPFNPQNGRYYNEHDPGCANYDSTRVVGGLQVNCAYEDCGGSTTIVVEDEVNESCDECGEGKMGRKQFEVEERKHERKVIEIPSVKAPNGKEIQKARLELGLTQGELAEYSDISTTTVSLVENNKASLNSVQEVCRALSRYKFR